jgi:DNA invertase Pin-like site-specific DNA recombinase
MGDKIGYAVSTKEQNIDSQLDQLAKAGCSKVMTDTISGTTKDRPGWSKLMACLRTGDTVTGESPRF